MKQFFVSVALCLFIASNAFSQQSNASLTGTVTDSNGAVVVGATVVVSDAARNFARTVVTNSDGVYVAAGLLAGRYSVTVERTGFQKFRLENVVVGAGQTVTADARLAAGVETVVVDSDYTGDFIDTQTSKVDSVIGEREIENLPLNGRNFLELALLTPGNSPAPNFDPTKTNTVVISSAGQLGRGGSVTIDGTDNNDDLVGGALINIPQDAVQEFQVATNRYSAEYGRSASGIVNVVTKGGTNAIRGSVSFFERDRRLQGLPATFDRSQPTPPFGRQQYSGAVGGPIIKDKLFWFAATEYRHQDGATLVGIRNVQTRTITRGFAPAPLRDLLLNTRLDYNVNDTNRLSFRYSFEDIDATDASKLDRPLGSASYRQILKNRFHSFMTNYTSILSPSMVNEISFSINNFDNDTSPTSQGIQFTFPSLLDGSSFRVPQATTQNRLQFADKLTVVSGRHTIALGGEFQRIDGSLNLGVFRQGRIEFVQDFANFDHNNDGRIDDGDLLFAVTLRSGLPTRDLFLPDVDNNHFAVFANDIFRIRRNLTFNFGLRYEYDSNVKNNSGYDDINPLVAGFYKGSRKADGNNFAPRVGFALGLGEDRFVIRGGYGIYYDRVTLELITLERGLDGRALPVEVRAGNALTDQNGVPIFLDQNGRFLPFAPTTQNPFIGFVLPGAGASGINIIDNGLESPMIQQSNLGFEWSIMNDLRLRADFIHNFGTNFIIGRNIGVVNNPVVGGPDRVVNLESSVKFFYDGLLLSLEKRFSKRFGFRAGYTLSKAFNYANDDQIPFSNGPLDSNNLQREFGPTPNDQRHRFTLAGVLEMPYGIRVSPILTLASGVPMDILVPGGANRIPALQRNAGGRLFKTGAELNAFLNAYNAGQTPANRLPLAPADARFNDTFSSLDLRISKSFEIKKRVRIEPIVEVFNVLNTTNILGVSNTNYSGFGNVLGTSGFGRPVTTAGGVFGSGGPRAFQFAARLTF